jgi:hypothetical protein
MPSATARIERLDHHARRALRAEAAQQLYVRRHPAVGDESGAPHHLGGDSVGRIDLADPHLDRGGTALEAEKALRRTERGEHPSLVQVCIAEIEDSAHGVHSGRRGCVGAAPAVLRSDAKSHAPSHLQPQLAGEVDADQHLEASEIHAPRDEETVEGGRSAGTSRARYRATRRRWPRHRAPRSRRR